MTKILEITVTRTELTFSLIFSLLHNNGNFDTYYTIKLKMKHLQSGMSCRFLQSSHCQTLPEWDWPEAVVFPALPKIKMEYIQ